MTNQPEKQPEHPARLFEEAFTGTIPPIEATGPIPALTEDAAPADEESAAEVVGW